MEESKEEKTGDGFLKIDTIWSEAEGNHESITVKEEIVSDIEPECMLSVQENDECGDENNSFVLKMADRDHEKSYTNFNEETVTPLEPLKKKITDKKTKFAHDASDLVLNLKSTCLHNTKNFKIVKKRLRCGDCRSLVCPECCKVMITTLQSHLSGSDIGNPGVYTCKTCKLAFHSLCSLQAHIRIHTMNTPYVCPDCGLIYNNIYFLILHLINKCYHVYKIVKYKCKNCPGTYFEQEIFSQHIQAQHIKFLYRCSLCSAAIIDPDNEFYYHKDNAHKNEKAQCLSYFRCSLCSNMVLPRFMFERHVSQHHNSSESYDIEYQCLCGYSYTLIGAFRAHIQHCNNKGVLPLQWSFLKKNLKTQEVSPSEIYKNKNDSVLGVSPNIQTDSLVKKSSLPKSLIKTNEINEKEKSKSIEVLVGGSGVVNSDGKNMRNLRYNSRVSDFTKDSNPTILEKSNDALESNVVYRSQNLVNKNSNNFQEAHDSSEVTQVVHLDVENAKDKRVENAFKNDIATLNVDRQCQSTTELQVREENEADQNGTGTSKTHYNHIPCDHLGYVTKSQGPESNKKDSQVGETLSTPSLEKTVSPDFHIMTELDDKTGVITTKKVSTKDVEEEKNKDVFGDETESHNMINVLPKLNNEKSKLKLGSSFFSCPFCIVLFPKQNSTFQQFKLHVESYHPDAALNIPVNQNENKKSENSASSTPEPNNVDLENSDPLIKDRNSISGEENEQSVLDKSVLKSQPISKELPLKVTSRNVDGFEGSSKENLQETDKDHEENIGMLQEKNCSDSNPTDGDEKENSNEESKKAFQTYSRTKEKNSCWTLKLSLQRCDSVDEESQQRESCLKQTEKTEVKDTSVNTNSSGLPQENSKHDSQNYKIYSIKVLSDSLKSAKAADSELEKLETSRTNSNVEVNTDGSVLVGEESEQNVTNDKLDTSNVEEDSEKRLRISFSFEEELKRTASDVEEDGETSKETNWSSILNASAEDLKVTEEKVESKPEEKEKSKREGEVWSQFYESLMLAEKLKKSKEKKKLFTEEKKKTVVTDYSAKRVVKKPKRYRESSDSDDSGASYYYSGSDAEILLTNDFADDYQVDETVEIDAGDNMFQKKQKLLKKLQNADEKFLDYLFEIINQKEKCLELYKKHSTLKASRYRQNLRSYRKKVLNGIKQGGKSHKLLRYQELLKKRNPVPSLENTSSPAIEGNSQRVVKKIPEASTDGVKVGERKRGRPRKNVDPAKIRERRRSDKEVDFIEKNFEREENDFSPSKRKRKLSSKLQYYKKINFADEKDDFSSGQVITNKPVDSNKKFSCAVCKEVFPEMADFREHILVHRMEENSYQCMECGECFVVRPSLEKHLHAFHKIKNTDKYITENGCCNQKKEAADSENEPLKENQCKVCKDQFDRPIDLTKHFRIHGMAFLKEFKKEGKTK